MWANSNSPLQRAQTYSHHAHNVFLCIYMYLHICERPENTRVGANCNSPSHMGAIENMGEFETWVNCNVSDSRQKRTQQHKGELQFAPTTHAKNLMPISMINDQ